MCSKELKLKGKSWVGNMYHQLESICQDVDEFINKDTVKLVEDQVQSVGMSVKRFYSNVMQDISSPFEDIMEPKAQPVDDEQVDMRDRVKSGTTIRRTSTRLNENELSVTQSFIDALRNTDPTLPIELEAPYADASQIAKTILHPREDSDVIIRNDTDNVVEENIVTRVSMPATPNSNLDNEVFPRTSSEDHKSSTLTIQKEIEAFDHENGKKRISDDVECLCQNNYENGKKRISDDVECHCQYNYENGKKRISHDVECLCQSNLPTVEDPNSDENRSLSASPVASADKDNEDNNTVMNSPLLSDCEAASKAFGKNEALCDSFSTADESVDLAQEEKEEEESVVFSTCSKSPKSSNGLESASANSIKKAENIGHSHAVSNGCDDISTQPSGTASCETKALDLESNEETYEFGDAIDDPNMETVDLSADEKQELRNIVFNGNFAHAAPRGPKNFGYYKKLIQDTFTSRKRISKEYEHLTILYGDIDKETNQLFRPTYESSSANTSAHAARTRLSEETGETEWELL